MLIIRQQQMDLMAQSARQRLLQEVAADVQAAAPGPVDAAVLAQTLDFALQCGMTGSAQIARVALALDGMAPSALPRAVLAPLQAYGSASETRLAALEAWSAERRASPDLPGAATQPVTEEARARPAGSASAKPSQSAAIVPCQEAQGVFWLEIELVGEDDRGIPWAAYEVLLPSGELSVGYLDGEGFARFDGLAAAGNCRIGFPEIDQDAVAFVASMAARPLAE
jgi:hypothetical protein